MNNETLQVTGRLNIKTINPYGSVTAELDVPNMVVYVGKAFIISRMAPSPPAYMSHIAIGSSNQPTSIDMTTLLSEATVSGNKVRTTVTTSTDGNSILYSAQFSAGAFGTQYTAQEAGIFNSSTNGTMLARTVFNPVIVSLTDIVVINWTITLN